MQFFLTSINVYLIKKERHARNARNQVTKALILVSLTTLYEMKSTEEMAVHQEE